MREKCGPISGIRKEPRIEESPCPVQLDQRQQMQEALSPPREQYAHIEQPKTAQTILRNPKSRTA
jgi:hypothetical protein